jgi:PAS domain S-box-containing protein
LLSSMVYKARSMSLKWKLLIPFFFFAFTGTVTMAYIGLTSQQRLIEAEEKKQILHHYSHFLDVMKEKEDQVRSLATMVSHNPEVQRFLAERNRQALLELLTQTYESLRKGFNIRYFHFHTPEAKSFLRLHQPERFGEEMSGFRKTIIDAIKEGRAVAGLEWGVMGFAIRGVAPIYYHGEMVGTVELGYYFGKPLLDEIHERWGVDLALYELRGDYYIPTAKSGEAFNAFLIFDFLSALKLKAPTVLIAPPGYPNRSILLGPVMDFSGKTVALLEISVDRSEIQDRLSHTRNLTLLVGLTGIAISFLFIFLVTVLFIRPIKEIVKEAQDIAQEKRERRLESRPGDEIGVLTDALNTMLEALRKRRMEIQDYARNLERRVQERTADLVAAMEDYRTLVEHVPLIVYRVLPDGTTEFINSYLTESLGYTIEEAVRDKTFWEKKICGEDLQGGKDMFRTCFRRGEECRVERQVRHKDGRALTFIDHAIPTRDESGRIKWVDGIMMDISELKRLQERALQTEEIRILGEISARMAHEIRNPLAAAGGFARRLRDSLPENDPRRELAQIIVKEVARLEYFLKILLTSIEPFDLSLSSVDVNRLLRSTVVKLDGDLKSREISVKEALSEEIPNILGDEERLSQAFQSLLGHAIVSIPEGEELFLSTDHATGSVSVMLRHKVPHLSDDDLEQFFFPHVEAETESTILDLPLSKIIIHRHGGRVDVFKEEEDTLTVKIEFPIRAKT